MVWLYIYTFLWPGDGPQWPKHVVSIINRIQDSCVLTYLPLPNCIKHSGDDAPKEIIPQYLAEETKENHKNPVCILTSDPAEIKIKYLLNTNLECSCYTTLTAFVLYVTSKKIIDFELWNLPGAYKLSQDFAKPYFHKDWTEMHDVTTIWKRNVCSFIVTF